MFDQAELLGLEESEIRRADTWERGWMLGRTMELVEVQTHLAQPPEVDYE